MAWGAVSVYLRSTAPQGLALLFHHSPHLDTGISFVLPGPPEDSGCGNTCCQQKDPKQGLSCCWHPRRMWLGKAVISLASVQSYKVGLAPVWVRAILGHLVPQHLLHARWGAGLFQGRA